MGESHLHQQHQLLHNHHPATALQAPRRTSRSRLGGVKGAGEIVEVQGGHIVRSTGRKDRHSKVCTAKGPRDRRVRLSAPTAIQFYDVQDRLGYDRPSKAVDWLIKNAKAAIDELAKLPAWHPTATIASSNPLPPPSDPDAQESETADAVGDSSKKPLPEAEHHPVASSGYGFGAGSFLPPSLDSDAIADTIKSFFPIATTSVSSASPPPIGFHNYPPDLSSCTGSQSQDLRLSLQSFQDPILLHHHHHQSTTTPTHHLHNHHPSSPAAEQALFSTSSAPLAFDTNSASWSEQSQRMVFWNAAEAGGGGGGGGGGYVFSVPLPQAVSLHPVLGQSPFLTQRGPLQSSNSPSVRAWADNPLAADHQAAAAMHHPGPSVSAFGFATAGSFSGFRIPARIQGEEEQDGVSNKPSSASSVSRH